MLASERHKLERQVAAWDKAPPARKQQKKAVLLGGDRGARRCFQGGCLTNDGMNPTAAESGGCLSAHGKYPCGSASLLESPRGLAIWVESWTGGGELLETSRLGWLNKPGKKALVGHDCNLFFQV